MCGLTVSVVAAVILKLTLLNLFYNGVCGFKDYASCTDVKSDLNKEAVDGEYTIYLRWKRNVGIKVYCACEYNDITIHNYIA